jgi:UDP-GlcNAc:undecaprenyl-phosphate/decaprenyl-phosphate GlcNAc-1-phosphate transferase
MILLIGTFLIALSLGLVLTPGIRALARARGWTDHPGERKVHQIEIPRVGGVAIYLSFFVALLVGWFSPGIHQWIALPRELPAIVLGGTLVFLLGLWDDIHSLPAPLKFLVQIAAAGIAYGAGLQIHSVSLAPGFAIQLGWMALPVTLFWFLLVINAINLIDGLDGLAAGVSLFAALVLLVFCLVTHRYLEAVGFAALAGATTGFLRYNFNPATIFMGDSGSYFLGYMLAALSVLGSVKSTASVALLIPILALGVPLIDTITAPIRRFIRGKGIFSPDSDHLHHRLLKRGLTHRNCVLVLYGGTILMGMAALLVVYASSAQTALILLILAAIIIVAFRKLGYMEYFAFDKVYGWLRDVTDEAGISRERRSFLGLQMEISEAKDMDTLWCHAIEGLERLGFDFAEIQLYKCSKGSMACNTPATPQDLGPPVFSANGTPYKWRRNGDYRAENARAENLFKLQLPLREGDDRCLGHMVLVKDLERSPITHFTLRRVEHLRRSVMGSLRHLV